MVHNKILNKDNNSNKINKISVFNNKDLDKLNLKINHNNIKLETIHNKNNKDKGPEELKIILMPIKEMLLKEEITLLNYHKLNKLNLNIHHKI